ncbi:uncharacterized protein ACMZJ9_022340 [Mantella aurantiaca]
MTTSMSMEKEQSHMTERILNLTLEIIYLLTGEGFPPKNLGDYITITKPSPHSMTPQRHNMEKILEVTQKMIGVLTGEVPIRCQDVTVYFSMEEWEYLEGHKDLYKDVMMDNQPPLTSPDGSSNRNPPERCPRPLYSRDSTQEDLTIPHHYQSGNLEDYNIVVKEEYKEENEEYGVIEEFSEEYKHVMMVAPHNRRCSHPLNSWNSTKVDITIPHHHQLAESPPERCPRPLYSRYSTQEDLPIHHHHQLAENPPERCPRPLYSRDSTQEDLTIPHHHQGEDVMKIKVEGEVEETYVRDDQQYKEEKAGMMRTSIEEDTPTEISTGHAMEKPSKDHLTLPPGCKMEDEDITGEKTMISSMDGGDHI